MKIRLIAVLLILASAGGSIFAQTPAGAGSSRASDIRLSNEIMLHIAEKFRAGEYAEARAGAMELIKGHETLKDTATEQFRSFSSVMGKTLYELQLSRQGLTPVVHWVEQPIADGFYFLAMIEFHDGTAEKALEYLQNAIFWDPVRAAFHSERAYMSLRGNSPADMGQVKASYLRALELADSEEDFAHALRGIGFLLIERGDLETALACYLRSIDFEPEDPATRHQIEFIRQSNPSLRKSMTKEVVASVLNKRRIPFSFDPVHIEVLMSIAKRLVAKGDKDAAKSLQARAAKMANTEELKRYLK